MKPLVVLIIVFMLSVVFIRLGTQRYAWAQAGSIAMFAMLCFTTIGHFVYAKGMSLMLPEFIPFKMEMVYLTGIMEVILGVALLWPPTRLYAGWVLILFFMLLLPANIFAAIRQLDYQKGTFDGPGLAYLWFRVPLQLFFMLWVYLSAVRPYEDQIFQ